MVKWTLILIALICLVISITYFLSDKLKNFINDLGPLLTTVSAVIALTVFLQFYNEMEKTKLEMAEKNKEEKAKHNSKMVALGSELINNIQFINLMEGDQSKHFAGTEVPGVTFEYSVMQNMLINGDITHHTLRSELASLLSQMKVINGVINNLQQAMLFKTFVSSDKHDAIKQMLIAQMRFCHSKFGNIKAQLIAIQGPFNEQWRNPERFTTEEYLSEGKLNEALIR